jgi:hypothetical protein
VLHQRSGGFGGRSRTTNVVGEGEHDLRRTVPPRGDVLGHEPAVRIAFRRRTASWSGSVAAGKTEVADLELAVGVHEKVTVF